MAIPNSTAKTKLNRLSYKGSASTDDLYSILDSNLVAHVGIVFDNAPLVLPMAYGRVGDKLYLHGSSGSRLMRALEQQPQICVAVTEINALKVARSNFNSGMHYRSVVVFGNAELVADVDKDAALDAVSNSLIPGRVAEVRSSTKKELAATVIIAINLEETSVKISVNEIDDPEEDMNKGYWAGTIPLITTIGEIIPADEEAASLPIPSSVKNFRTGPSKAR